MKYGVYGQLSNAVAKAVGDGLVLKGHKAVYQRAEVWNPWDAIKDFDRVVVMGLRGKYTEAWKHHAAEGTPVIIREAPHFRDVDRMAETFEYRTRQQRLSLGQHSWIPSFPCPSDRFEALGLEIIDGAGGDYVLVCGQTNLDTQHGLTNEELAAWLAAAGRIVAKAYKLPVRWRPHPMNKSLKLPSPDEMSDPEDDSLEQDLLGARAVVTFNSTVGVSAARLGIPIYIGGRAAYEDLARFVSVETETVSQPITSDVAAVMSRIAYTQWTNEELEVGTWVETIEKEIAGRFTGHSLNAHERFLRKLAGVADEGQEAEKTTRATLEEMSHREVVSRVALETSGEFTARGIEESVKEQSSQVVRRALVRRQLDILAEDGALIVITGGGRGPTNPRTWSVA